MEGINDFNHLLPDAFELPDTLSPKGFLIL